MRTIGIMSGTSLDGIDVADVELGRRDGVLQLDVKHFLTAPFEPSMRAALLESLPPNAGTAEAVARLGFALGEALASAVLRALESWRVAREEVDLIGSHGLTLFHAPGGGATLQIGEAAVIAARTGITCVSDFRVADVAEGGQGAPLVPFVDRELFADETEDRAALNIGGIANVTLLPASAAQAEIVAFDTGPGNMLVDQATHVLTGGKQQYDENGARAAAGAVDRALLDELLREPYFALPPPKSTGRETFGQPFADRALAKAKARKLRDDDLIATLTALTAVSIADAIPHACARVIVSGGGARNLTLLRMIQDELGRRSHRAIVEVSDTHGVNADQKEALAFAVLAYEAVRGRVNHLPHGTGARASAILGKISPGSNYSTLMRSIWS